MPATPGFGRWLAPRLSLGLTVLALAIAALGEAASHALVWNRAAILDGEVWRLWTGHLVHADAAHLFWNVVGFASIAAHFETAPFGGTRRLAWILLAAAAAVGGALLLWPGTPDLYRGLSGVAYAPMVALLIGLGVHTGLRIFPVVTGLIAVKAVLELVFGVGLFDAFFGGLPTAPEVHAVGFVVGLAAAWAHHAAKNSVKSQTAGLRLAEGAAIRLDRGPHLKAARRLSP